MYLGFQNQLVWLWHLPAMTEMSPSEPATTRWGVYLTIKHNYLVM